MSAYRINRIKWNFLANISLIKQQKLCYSVLKNTSLKWSYCMGPTDRPLVGATVGQMLTRAADKFGERECIVVRHQNIRKNFHDFNAEAKTLAAGLLSLGFSRGDRICIWSPNNYEWCLTKCAAAKAGLVLVNLNPAYRVTELKYSLNKVEAKGLIAASKYKTSNYYEMLSEIAPEIINQKSNTEIGNKNIPSLKYFISMDSSEKGGAFSFHNILQAGESNHEKMVNEFENIIQFDDPYNIQFTSGTTGNPKAALISHFNSVNNALFYGNRNNFNRQVERVGINAPLFHIFGSIVAFLSNICYGNVSIFPAEGHDPAEVVKTLKEEKVSTLYGTPTMFIDILNEYRKNPFKIEHLHAGTMTGAPCPAELILSLTEKLKMKDLIVVYGLTETGPVTLQSYPGDSISTRSTTVGCPLDHTEVKIVNDKGEIVPIGNPGELYLRGYSIFHGYWGDEEKTKKEILPDRWFKTGDQCVMDENGYCKIIGRIKDMIIRGGENIYPAEIENFFLGHRNIIEAQVFGIPHERLGEEVAMWIRLSETDISVDEIKEWAKGKISHFKIPKFIKITEEFPRTTSGKIQKFKLKEETIKILR